jgi:hypothetical protein
MKPLTQFMTEQSMAYALEKLSSKKSVGWFNYKLISFIFHQEYISPLVEGIRKNKKKKKELTQYQ